MATMPCDATEATLMQTPDALYRHKQFPEMVCFVRDASNNLRVVVQFHTWSPGAALVFSEEPCFKRVLRRKLQPVLGEDGLQLTIIGQHHVVPRESSSRPTAVVPGPAAGESFGAHWLEPRVSTIAGAASVAAAARHVKRAAWSMRIRSVLRASARPGGGRGAAAVPARCADLFLGSKHAIFLIIFLVSTQGGRQHNGSVTRDHTDSHPTLTPLTTWRHTWRSTR